MKKKRRSVEVVVLVQVHLQKRESFIGFRICNRFLYQRII